MKYKYCDVLCESWQFKRKISPILPPNIIFAQISFQPILEGCQNALYTVLESGFLKLGIFIEIVLIIYNTILSEFLVKKISH